jgi:hypothetical protein
VSNSICFAESFSFAARGGITSSSSFEMMRWMSSLSAVLPGTTVVAPLLPVPSAPAWVSSRSLPFRSPSSGP